jgi:hypothetical protein
MGEPEGNVRFLMGTRTGTGLQFQDRRGIIPGPTTASFFYLVSPVERQFIFSPVGHYFVTGATVFSPGWTTSTIFPGKSGLAVSI